ncbi:MAG: outer-membrane lipoprotein carrier protein LolA [Afipia sp.]|nr:outer-membrane lipoprotein carrier protein LolA [Afipia sp.]MBS4002395.1 outer-membrane lipoprotein carrier protein LolA [Afipia sp.]WIG53308.1 MAG: Outer membrane lipoprotein carrier protein LolA [Afipia sp.]
MKKPHRNQPSCQPRRPARVFSVAKVPTLALAATIAASLMMPSALAQAVPVPKPAPKARPGDIPAPQAQAPNTSTPPTPIIPDLRSLFGGGTPSQNFDANQKALAGKVSTYLSSLQNVSGNFVQVGPDGKRTTGDFYIQKPGKIRFEYDDPSPIALVADGTSVVVLDRRLATQDVYPLSQTPLRYLLSDRIDLLRDTNVVGVSSDNMFISVTIEEKQALVGTSRLMLMIGAKDNQLKQWTVTDPQGYDTTVAVYNLDTTKKLDPSMFKIDFTNYQNSNN